MFVVAKGAILEVVTDSSQRDALSTHALVFAGRWRRGQETALRFLVLATRAVFVAIANESKIYEKGSVKWDVFFKSGLRLKMIKGLKIELHGLRW